MSLKKCYCDFYYFALWSVYLCAWCRVFFLFLFRLLIKVTRPSFFEGVPSYFEALWYPQLYFYRKSNT